MDVQTWTSLSIPPQKYGSPRGCRAAIAGNAQYSVAEDLLEGLAAGRLVF